MFNWFPSKAPAPTLFAFLVLSLGLSTGSVAPPNAGAVTITWNNPAGGVWSDPANWSPADVPDSYGESAVLPALGGPYQVTLDRNPTIDALDIAGGDPTLDLAGYATTAVSQLYNSGAILGYRGILNSAQFHNQGGGVVQVANDDSILVSGGVANDGTIIIGPGLNSSLHLLGTATFTGTGTLRLDNARIACPLGVPQYTLWLNNGAGHTVRGSGLIIVPIANSGNVHADAGQTLRIRQYLANYGTARVSNNSVMLVDFPLVANTGQIIASDGGGAFDVMMPYAVGGTINNTGGGTLVSDGGDLRMSSGTIVNGTIQRPSGTGAVRITIATPQNLTVAPDAELRVDGQIDLMADGSSLINNGIVRVSGRLNVGGNSICSVSLTGSGAVVLDNGTLDTPAGATMVNAAGHTIRGCGTISANLVNNGVVEVDCTGGVLWIQDRTIRNENILRAKRGTMWVKTVEIVNNGILTSTATGQARFENGATVRNSLGTIVAEGNVLLGWNTTVKIIGGVLDGAGAGSFRNHGQTTLEDVTIGPGAVFTTLSGKTTRASGILLTNQGTNQIVAGGAFIADPATDYLQTGGATVLDGGTLTVPQGLQIEGALRGRGTIVADVYNAGALNPDVGPEGITITGDYYQLADGELGISVSGDGSQFSRLTVSGEATLDGRLVVATATGFNPGVGQSFDVMAFGSHDGAFVECVAADPGNGFVMVPIYEEAQFTVQITPVSLAVNDPAVPRALRFYSRGAALGLELPEVAELSVRAYDVSGREVARLADGVREAGIHRFDLRGAGSARSLPSGVYFARAVVRMSGKSQVRSARVILVK